MLKFLIYTWLLLFTPFLVLFSIMEQRVKVPWKFIILDKVELLVSLISALSLTILLHLYLGMQASISLLIWSCLIFILIKRIFGFFINMRLFGYMSPGHMIRDRKSRKGRDSNE